MSRSRGPDPRGSTSPWSVHLLFALTLVLGAWPAPAAGTGKEQRATSWLDRFDLAAFADAYVSWNINNPRPADESSILRTHQLRNGFGLTWAGLDLGYEPRPAGGTVSLRLGPMAATAGGNDEEHSLHYLKQVFVSLRPVPSLRIDVGKFDTPYGYEVVESQANLSYTQGVVFWMCQPYFHTGLRLTYTPVERFSASVIAVNGWDNTVDNNDGKTIGLQLGYTPSERLSLNVGYLAGPEQDDVASVACGVGTVYDRTTGLCMARAGSAGETVSVELAGAGSRLRHLFDLIVTAKPIDRLTLVLNVDLVADTIMDAAGDEQAVLWYGIMAAAELRLLDELALALRGEFLHDPDGAATGAGGLHLATSTVTLTGRITSHLVLRLDARLDMADQEVFFKDLDDSSRLQFTAALGAVVTTE